MTMKDVDREINTEYENELDNIKESVEYDVIDMRGSRSVWKDVLAVYSVKVNTDEDNPQEVATMNEEKKELLKDIFWEMQEIDLNIPKWRSHLIRQNRATYSNLENHLIQITEPGDYFVMAKP